MKLIHRKGQPPRLSAKDARKLKVLRERSYALLDKVIEDGFGHVPYRELRKICHPAVAEMLAVDEKIFDMYAEWERETGLKATRI